ncbi:hypothetical protein KXX13_001403 [Aspergillus fumigatus]|nr:hypothetical protein CNMCM8714_000021 [Aspergillus fumigatus]KAH1454612.1 hypothetical protein KXX13_001403 [Aspergillus fumigatus]KAH1531361.1 hypothetical protein KXX18_007072 [Aspergillus fumigatus]KAH2089479.1 hypothetical protein KXW32_003179 [Aspergillus fumigatus]KAH2231298.1 hypothetical protein KXV37_001866 [Aspergillus fumigatus]
MAILGLLPNPNWPQQPLPPRLDRQYTTITAENAQGLFSPDACIFVGNLKITLEDKDLVRDVQQTFSAFGPCHVKIKRDKRKIPTAFVQFEKVEHAVAALAENDLIKLHDRWLRIEKIKGKRTARLGHRSGLPVSPHDFETALTGRGHFESCFLEEVYFLDLGFLTTVFTVTFAYVDDYRDAIKAFERHPMYYLQPLDIEGNPTFSWVLPQPSGPSSSFRRSRSKEVREAMRNQGRSRMPLPAEFQPKTGSGKTIEDYTREINTLPHFGLSENLVLDVVEELEAEQRHKCLSEEWAGFSSNGTEPTPATTTDNDSTTSGNSSAVGSDADESTSGSRSRSKGSSNTASTSSTADFESLIESTSTSTTTFTSYLEVVPECIKVSSRGRSSGSCSVSVSTGSTPRLRLRSCSSSADLPPRKPDTELFFGNEDNDNHNHNGSNDQTEKPSTSISGSNTIESKSPSNSH